MNREDLFAPPTQEELDLFAPPTQEEIDKFITPIKRDSTSIAQALGHNFASGATLGFSDELAGALNSPVGAVKTLLEKIGIGNIQDSDIKDYVEARDKERKLLDLLSEEHPIASFTGNVAGSFVPSLLAGAGVLGGAAKALTTSKKVADAAKTGALIGAASNLGASKNDSLGADLKDVAVGSAIGGLTGAVIPAFFKGAQNVKNTAEDFIESPATNYFAAARQAAKDGTSVISKQKGSEFGKELMDLVEKFGPNAKSTLSELGDNVKNANKLLKSSNKIVDASDFLNIFKEKTTELGEMGIKTADQDLGLLQKALSDSNISDSKSVKLADLLSLKNKLNGLTGIKDAQPNEALRTDVGTNIAKSLAGQVDEVLTKNDELYKNSDLAYKNLMRALEALKIDPGTAFQKTNGKYEFKAGALADLTDKIRRSEALGGAAGKLKQDVILGRVGRDLSNTSPELLDELSKMAKPAERFYWSSAISGLHPTTKAGLLEKGSAIAGHVVGATERAAGNLGQTVGKTISKMSPVDLEKMAAYFETKGTAGEALASKLMEIKNQDVTARNATLFTLLQNPTYRTLMTPEFTENDKDKAKK